jgi:thiamine biosynthesis protein ThiS
VRIQVNGEFREVEEQLSLRDLIEVLDLRLERLAIELNGNVVRRGDWESRVLNSDDKVEIVHFVGGG